MILISWWCFVLHTRALAWFHAVMTQMHDFYFLNCNQKFLSFSASLVDFLHAFASSQQPNSCQLTCVRSIFKDIEPWFLKVSTHAISCQLMMKIFDNLTCVTIVIVHLIIDILCQKYWFWYLSTRNVNFH